MQIARAGREYMYVTIDPAPGESDSIEISLDGSTWQAATRTDAGVYRVLVAGPDATSNPVGTLVGRAGTHDVRWRWADSPELIERGAGELQVVDVVHAKTTAALTPTSPAVASVQGRTGNVELTAADLFTYGIAAPVGWGANWRAKLAAAKAGTGSAVLAVAGDSIATGYYTSNLLTKSYPALLGAALQAYAGDGGSGFLGVVHSEVFHTFQSVNAAIRAQWAAQGGFALTGTWAVASGDAAPGGTAVRTQAVGAAATVSVRGRYVSIWTIPNNGGNADWTYTIDGGAPVSVVDAGTSYSTRKTTIDTGVAGDHTVVVTYAGDGAKYLYLTGVAGDNATGARLDRYVRPGGASSLFIDNGLKNPDWDGGYQRPADLIIYGAGVNDAAAGTTGDAYAKNVRKYLQGVRDNSTLTGAVDVLIAMPHVGKYDNTNYLYQDYQARLRGIADTYGAALVDFWALGRGSWNAWSAAGYWGNASAAGGGSGTDQIHLSDTGAAYMASVLAQLVIPA